MIYAESCRGTNEKKMSRRRRVSFLGAEDSPVENRDGILSSCTSPSSASRHCLKCTHIAATRRSALARTRLAECTWRARGFRRALSNCPKVLPNNRSPRPFVQVDRSISHCVVYTPLRPCARAPPRTEEPTVLWSSPSYSPRLLPRESEPPRPLTRITPSPAQLISP